DRSWLRIHNTHEWPDLYEYEEDLLRFFDATLKGLENDWSETPRIRLSILDPGGGDTVNRPETSWPPERVVPTALYLNVDDDSLSLTPVRSSGVRVQDAREGVATFTLQVEEDIEVIGPSSLRVWVSVGESDDMELYAFVQKVDANDVPILS